MEGKLTKANDKKSIFVIALFSVVICFFVCGMSPLYDFYYFLHDCSVYYVMGRGMKAGLVPYVDLFDHKGLYLYFINMIGSLISYRHVGMYIVSIITTFLYGFFIYKILSIYDKKNIVKVITTFVMICLYFLSYFSNNLLNPEQYILTIEIISIYLYIRLIRNDVDKKIKYKYFLIEGILFSIVLFIKFNHILFFIGLFISYIIYIIKNNNDKSFVKNIMYVLMGVAIGVLPVLIYCIVTNSLYDMIDAYFVLNIKYGMHGFAKYDELSKMDLLIRTFGKYAMIIVIVLVSCGFTYVIYKKKEKKEWLISYFILVIVNMIIMITPLTGLNYYATIVIPYFIPAIVFFVDKVYMGNERTNIWKIILCMALMIVCMYMFSYREMVTDKSINDNKESIKMARGIRGSKNKKDQSVLLVGYCTYVYNEANVLPGSKYFYIPIIRYEDKPELYDTIKNEVLTNKHNIVGIMYDQKFIRDIFGDSLVEHLKEKYKIDQSYGNKFIYKRKW